MVWSAQSPALTILAVFLLCSVAAGQTDLARPFEPDAQTVELYHFDDPAGGACTDAMGGPAGTLQGVTPTLGRFGGGASLTGEQDWADITRKAAPAPQTGLTVECWVKFPARAQGDLICRNSAYMMRLSGGLQAYIGIDGSWRKVVGSRPVPIGRWVHLAMTYDQATREVRIYLDGRLDVAGKPEGLTEGKLNAGSETLRLGTNTWNPAGGMVEAYLDELRVSSVARTYAPLPSPGVEMPPPGTNLVTNSSFEFGRHGWRPESESDGGLQWTVLSGDAAAGRCFLRSTEPGSYGLMSYPIPILRGQSYTLSVALRADKPADVRLAINATGLAPDARRPGRNQNVKVTTEWQRFSLKYALPQDYPAEHVYVSVGKPREVQLDVDAVSLVAGDGADFVASDASDLGVALDLPQGNTLDLASSGRIAAQLVNGSKVARTVSIESRVLDWLGQEVAAERLFTGELPPLSARPVTVTVPTTRVGWFTLEIRTSVDGQQVSRIPYVVNVVAPMDHRGDAFTSPLGMNTHMEREPGAHLQHNLGTLARYGVKWIRAWWGWGMAEKQPGQFDWTEYDRQFSGVNATGMQVMPILLRYYPNFEQSWAGKTEEIQQPPYDLKQWGDFVQATVTRYRGRIRAWEVWNEPSYTMDAATYAGILKTTYERAKAADPQSVIVGFAGVPLEYARDTFKAGAAASLDVLSHHSYSQLGRPFSQQAQLQTNTEALLKESGVKVPVWHSEQGSGADGAGYLGLGASEEDCALNLAQAYLSALSVGVERFFWFSAQTSPTYGWGVFYEDYVPRPRLVALNGLARLLDGRKVTGRLALPTESIACVMLEGQSGAAAALWNLQEPLSLILKDAKELRSCDLFLNPTTEAPADKLVVQLQEGRPAYLLAPGLSAEELAGKLKAATVSGLEELPLDLSLRPAGPDRLEVQVRNTGTKPLDVDLQGEAAGLLPGPGGQTAWKIRDLPHGEVWTTTLGLAAKPVAGRRYPVHVACTVGGARLRQQTFTREVAW